MTIKSALKSLFIILTLALFITACGSDNNTGYSFDYSDAPDLPDTTNALSTVSSTTGLTYYVITEGDPTSFDVVIRDDILVYFTSRLEDGDIFESSYVNGSTSAIRVNTVGTQSAISIVGTGFVEGVIGMKEGERRVLVIPSELNTAGQTVTLDIELESIDY